MKPLIPTSMPFNRFGSPASIAGLYLIIGLLWIAFSDELAVIISVDQEMLNRISLYKGWGYVIITAGLLHWLINRYTASLKESETKLRLIFESSQDAIGVSRAGVHVLVNPAYVKMFGYINEKELLGTPIIGLIAPESQEIVANFMLRRSRGEAVPNSYEVTAMRRDGSRFLMNTMVSTYTLRGENHTLVILRDVTETKKAEDDLRNSERKLRTLFEILPVGVSILNEKQNIVLVNSALERILNIKRDDLLQDRLYQHRYLHADGRPMQLATDSASAQALSRQQAVYNVETGIVHDSGQIIWTSVSAVPVEFPDWKVVVVTTDITERKRNEDAAQRYAIQMEQEVAEHTADLRHANTELARAARAKDEFLASMSHELRTPLNAILTLTESLQEGIYTPLDERQLKPLRTISESGHHLLNLINDILDLSKIEAGKLNLQINSFEVESLCQASLRLIQQQAHKKQQQVLFKRDPSITNINADGRYLKQMLVNLLSNAVKFTPEGGQIGLEVQGFANQGTAHLTVWDTGIGIAPEDAPRLFQPFTQIDSGLARQFSGTGLGLSLVVKMAELHGGSVALTSDPGKGSRFTISLPWTPVQIPQETGPLYEIPLPNFQRALIIEDSPSSAEQLERYMRETGAQVTRHPRGELAVEKAIAVQADVILLDISLPGISGWDVLAQLKANEQTRTIPVIVIAVVDDPLNGLAMGAVDYLVKPISRARLYEALWKGINSALPDVADCQPVILIAEDHIDNRTTFVDFLSMKGYRVIVADNGIEAVRLAHEEKPDLILMDIQMPEMDGLEAMRRLRAEPNFLNTPIFALTALAMPGDRELCLNAGANEYLSKPISLKQLAHLIEIYLQARTA